MRTFALFAVALLVGALFANNAIRLAGETHPLVWGGAVAAAIAGAFVFLLLSARPPRALDRLAKGVRKGVLPLAAAGVAAVVIGSGSSEGQLITLSLFAGFLATALVDGVRGRFGG